MDPVSFLFHQILSQVEYLFEKGYLSPENYSTVAGALLQATPPSTPSANRGLSLGTNAAYASSIESPVRLNAESTSSKPGGSAHEPPPLPSSSSAAVSSACIPPPHRKKSSMSTPSLLKFKSKSNTDQISNTEASLPKAPFGAADEPELGKTNRRLRSVFEGGFILSQVVDQALALTPGVPEGLRESIVEKVEEASGDYVKKATDPRNQALWKENASRVGSSALRAARGGGGTSRASRAQTSNASSSASQTYPPVALNAETGEFSIISSSNEASEASTTSSVHSFFSSPDLNITTVITVSRLPSSVEPVQRYQSMSVSEQTSSQDETGYSVSTSHARTGAVDKAPPSGTVARDPNIISGHDW